MSVIRYKSLRDSIHVQLLLTQPILDWFGVPARFFGMIHSAFRGKLPINPADFSITHGTLLSEFRAKYSLYGGATSVSLLTDRLAFDFPNLLPSDYSVATDVLATVHDAFPKALADLSYDRIEVQSNEHIDVSDNETVVRFLDKFKTTGLQSYFDAPVVQQPTCKFNVTAQDQSWQCGLALEPSLLSHTALFMVVTVSIRNVNPSSSFLDKQTQVRGLIRSMVASVGLENSNGA